MDTKLIVSASPHVRSEETTQSLMANVIVALCPCVVASAIIFGVRALLVTAVSVIASVAFEWLYCKLLKKPNPISDLSAVVTGIILAMNVPVGMPIGQLIIGDLVAIVIVKQLFGGIGMGIGYTLTVVLMATIREILGSGTWLGFKILPDSVAKIGIMTQAPGAFFCFGLLMAGCVWLEGKLDARIERKSCCDIDNLKKEAE